MQGSGACQHGEAGSVDHIQVRTGFSKSRTRVGGGNKPAPEQAHLSSCSTKLHRLAPRPQWGESPASHLGNLTNHAEADVQSSRFPEAVIAKTVARSAWVEKCGELPREAMDLANRAFEPGGGKTIPAGSTPVRANRGLGKRLFLEPLFSSPQPCTRAKNGLRQAYHVATPARPGWGTRRRFS